MGADVGSPRSEDSDTESDDDLSATPALPGGPGLMPSISKTPSNAHWLARRDHPWTKRTATAVWSRLVVLNMREHRAGSSAPECSKISTLSFSTHSPIGGIFAGGSCAGYVSLFVVAELNFAGDGWYCFTGSGPGDVGWCAGKCSFVVVRSSKGTSDLRYGFAVVSGVGDGGCAGYVSMFVVTPRNFAGLGTYDLGTCGGLSREGGARGGGKVSRTGGGWRRRFFLETKRKTGGRASRRDHGAR